ncbi:MAG: hypothetical protein Q9162_003911 [Coniocarpon cinnabarinum]
MKEAATRAAKSNRDDGGDVEKAKKAIGARPECFRSTAVEIFYVLTCTMAIGMQALLVGSVTVITSFIGAELDMTQAEITWMVASSSLACGAFLLFFGRLTDLMGRKTIFVASLFIFAVLNLGAGFAKNGITLDVMTGLMGLMSASAVPPAIGSLGSTYDRPSKRKNYAFACFSAGNPLGYVFGTVFSGVATQLFGWRASFWLLAMIYLVTTIVAIFTVPADTTAKLSLSVETLKRFDVVGALLTIGGIGMFTGALSLGDTAPEGWKTPYVLVLLIVGFALMVLFALWELHYPHPLVPMWVWRDRNFTLLLLIMSIGLGVFSSALFWVTLYIQRFWTGSALHVAAYVLPAAVSGILANIFAGMLLHKIPGKWIMGASCCIYTVAFILLGCNRHSTGYWPFIFPALSIITWAADLQFNVVNMYILSSLPSEQQGIAGGIFQTVSRLGSAIGFGITTALYDSITVPKSGYYANDPSVKFAGLYWFGCGMSFLTVCMVPFLSVGTQGNEEKDSDERMHEQSDER